MRMLQRNSSLTRYGLALFGGFVVLFLVRHEPVPKDVPGLLAVWPSGYQQLAERWNLIHQLNMWLNLPLELLCPLEILLIFGLLFLIHAQLLRDRQSHPQRRDTIGPILLWTALLCIPLLLMPFLFSRDIYSYIMYGRMTAIYGANPALTPPLAFPNDPFLQYLVMWRDTPSVYGPVWTLCSALLTDLAEAGGGSLWSYLLLYKLAMIAAHLLSVLLIWRILGAWKPEQQVWGTLLYAWNPVVLAEFAGSAHNDVLMICLMLLALRWAQRGLWRRAIVALVAAALVKWIAIILLPIYLLMLLAQPQPWVTRVLRAGQMAAIVLVTAGLFYLPYGDVLRAIGAPLANQAAMRAENSLGLLLIKGLDAARAKSGVTSAAAWRVAAEAALAAGSKLLVALAWLVGLYAIWRRPTFERCLEVGAWLFVALLLLSPVFRVWYVTWPLALAALLDWRRVGRAVYIFGVSSVCVYIDLGLNNFFTLLVFAPVIAVLIYQCSQVLPARWRSLAFGPSAPR